MSNSFIVVPVRGQRGDISGKLTSFLFPLDTILTVQADPKDPNVCELCLKNGDAFEVQMSLSDVADAIAFSYDYPMPVAELKARRMEALEASRNWDANTAEVACQTSQAEFVDPLATNGSSCL